ncbi:hypothetical protein ACFL3E_01895 [Patescibacteria group bacterium]
MNKKAVSSLIFGIGLIALLIGAMTNLYDAKIGALIMLGVWIVGGALVALLLGKKGDSSPPTQQPPTPPAGGPPPQQPTQ